MNCFLGSTPKLNLSQKDFNLLKKHNLLLRETQLNFLHFEAPIAARGNIFLLKRHGTSFFSSKCGPRIDLSLRPLLYLAQGSLTQIYTQATIWWKKEVAGRIWRQKCLHGSQKDAKIATIPRKTVVSTIMKGILMITRAS